MVYLAYCFYYAIYTIGHQKYLLTLQMPTDNWTVIQIISIQSNPILNIYYTDVSFKILLDQEKKYMTVDSL